ncbi:hypothetical protein CBL_10582 [Carabus blaptoides fortunei]
MKSYRIYNGLRRNTSHRKIELAQTVSRINVIEIASPLNNDKADEHKDDDDQEQKQLAGITVHHHTARGTERSYQRNDDGYFQRHTRTHTHASLMFEEIIDSGHC